MPCTLEICVDNARDLALAVAGGADRIELCSALNVGGLTPDAELLRGSRNCLVPVYAMIRPRAGGFSYTGAEKEIMLETLNYMHHTGVSGVVIGAANEAYDALDHRFLETLVAKAGPLGVTLHRVVDTLPDPAASVATAKDLGIERILTSGGQATAEEGAPTIAKMLLEANGQIEIMAGGSVRSPSIPKLRTIGITSFHASCRMENEKAREDIFNISALEDLKTAIDTYRI